jgi:Zn-dependent protease with chaperone function
MLTVTALVLAAVAVVALPRVISPVHRRAVSPRLLAGTHLVSLAGLALLSAGVAVCAGLGLISAVVRAHGLTSGCGPGAGGWALLPAGLALLTLGPLGWHTVRVLQAAHGTELNGLALLAARPRSSLSGDLIWVLPSAEPAAHAGGLRHPRAVITSGLLNLLDPAEQQAVCEHEAAHVRLGHPRLLLAGAAIARAYGFLPPVRDAWSGLRRELEAAADDEAVKAVGRAPVISALAKAALAGSVLPEAAAGFGDPGMLRYRLARLQDPHRPSRGLNSLVTAAGLTLAVTFAWSACVLATGGPGPAGVAACLATLAAAGLRPLWPAAAWHLRKPPRR